MTNVPAHAENTTNKPPSKSDKVPSIMIGRDFYTKPRNRKWINEHGAEAVLVLQTLWIACSQETNGKIRKDEAGMIAFPIQMKEEKIISILESAVKVGLLDEDSEHYFNSQILKDQESYIVKRQNYRKGREKRTRIQGESRENPGRILPESRENHIECEYEYESEYVDLKKEDTRKPVPLPATLDTPEHRQALDRWQKYLRKHNKRLDRMQLDTLVLNWANRPPGELIAAINQSIERDYRKLVYEPPDERTERGAGKPKFSTTDQIEKIMNFEIKEIGVSRK